MYDWVLTIMVFGAGSQGVSITTFKYDTYANCQAAANANKAAMDALRFGQIVQTCTKK